MGHTTAASTYPGGRGGKERAASLRAEQRLAPGGGAPRPGGRTSTTPGYPGGGAPCPARAAYGEPTRIPCMLSREDNELLTRTGPGTPMGNLYRRFWLPALLPDELPTPDSDPIRFRILRED